jgi:hypothetical protein
MSAPLRPTTCRLYSNGDGPVTGPLVSPKSSPRKRGLTARQYKKLVRDQRAVAKAVAERNKFPVAAQEARLAEYAQESPAPEPALDPSIAAEAPIDDEEQPAE